MEREQFVAEWIANNYECVKKNHPSCRTARDLALDAWSRHCNPHNSEILRLSAWVDAARDPRDPADADLIEESEIRLAELLTARAALAKAKAKE